MTFSENEIRPKELDEAKIRAIQKDIGWLAANRDKFVEINCPACSNNKYSLAFEKYNFRFDSCRKCRTVFMNPRATESLLGEFYARSAVYDYWNEYIFQASRAVRRKKIFRPRVKKILKVCDKLHINTNVIVEVGAAAGMFCEEILRSKRFNRIVGIEPSVTQAATCRNLGIEVIEKPVEQVLDFDGIADVVACFETMEHVFDPFAFITWCNNLLAPGGLLVLTCPNYEGFDILTLGTISDSLDAEHINLFNPDSLMLMIGRLGLEIIECTTPGELDAEIVRNKVLAGEVDLGQQPFLHKVLIADWDKQGQAFQEYLKANRLSSHMWLVARKQ